MSVFLTAYPTFEIFGDFRLMDNAKTLLLICPVIDRLQRYDISPILSIGGEK